MTPAETPALRLSAADQLTMIVGSMRNFASIADDDTITAECNAPVSIRVWADMLDALRLDLIAPADAPRGKVVAWGQQWTVGEWRLGGSRVTTAIFDPDFTHDAVLAISGDFPSDVAREAYAQRIAARLSAPPPTAREAALVEAARWLRDSGDFIEDEAAWEALFAALAAYTEGE